MSVERDIRYELLARLCPNTTGQSFNRPLSSAPRSVFQSESKCKMLFLVIDVIVLIGGFNRKRG